MQNKFRIKEIVLLLILFICSAAAFTQPDPKTDSLLKVLKSQKNSDTGKVNTLNALSRRLTQKDDFTNAVKYAEEAVLIANNIVLPNGIRGFKKGIGNAYNNLGNIYFYQGNYAEALTNHFASLKPRVETGDKKGMVISYNNIGLVYWNQGNYPDAYKNYLAALKIRKEIGDKRAIGLSYNILGVIYDDDGNYAEAIKNYLAALKNFEEIGDVNAAASPYNNIGEIYRKQENYQEALKYYGESLKLFEKSGDKGGVGGIYNNTGLVYGALKKYTDAKNFFLRALKIFQETDNQEGIAGIYGNLGIVYYEQGKVDPNSATKDEAFTNALKSLFDGLKIFEETEKKEGMAESYIAIGKVYTEQRDFTEAKNYLTKGLTVSRERGIKELVKDCYEAMAKLDSATGNWESAYLNRSLYIIHRDSLMNKDNTKRITEFKMQYEFDKKEDSMRFQQALTDVKLRQQTLLSQQQQQTILLNEKEFALIGNEKQIQLLQLEKEQAGHALQKAEAKRKQGQLVLLNKEKDIQSLELNKQKQMKNYILIGLILFATTSFFIYRNYRTRQILKLQTLRNKIASDLHDDVGSTLSSISIFSQMAQQQSKEVIPLLETIDESSRKMLDAMADIVWTINPENDQFEKIILRMRSFAYELLGAKNIDFEFIADDDITKIKLQMNVRKNLYLIFKEATNNMVKYAEAGKAMFTLKEENNKLILLIRDNGKGFDTSGQTLGNGLKNMKKRAEEIKGRLTIESFPGNGTTIQLSVPV